MACDGPTQKSGVEEPLGKTGLRFMRHMPIGYRHSVASKSKISLLCATGPSEGDKG